ncbi:hypothetical protein Tco_0788744 [Tanacetum coccineum]
MLVEMTNITKKVPMGIVGNVLVKNDKFLFPFDFVVIDMLEARYETMILSRPFLTTIHAEINDFNKEISLGIRKDRITFDIDKKIHNLTTPVKKVHGRCGKKARIDDADPTIPKVRICRPIKQDYNETFKIWPTCYPTKKVCNGGEDIYEIDEKGKLKQWYCCHDDKRRSLTGKGLSFPDYLLVKYEGNQGSDLIWIKAELGPTKDPRARIFDDYKWVFDLEID